MGRGRGGATQHAAGWSTREFISTIMIRLTMAYSFCIFSLIFHVTFTFKATLLQLSRPTLQCREILGHPACNTRSCSVPTVQGKV